jgi:hypothetical protein
MGVHPLPTILRKVLEKKSLGLYLGCGTAFVNSSIEMVMGKEEGPGEAGPSLFLLSLSLAKGWG